jgi:hypothetical protein
MMSMTQRKEIILIAAIAFLVSASPLLARWYVFGMPGIIGTTPFYHQRISGYMAAGNFSWYDPLSFGGRPYTYPPFFSIILAGFAVIFSLEVGGLVMMGLMGAAAAVLCFLLAKELIGLSGKKVNRRPKASGDAFKHGFTFSRKSAYTAILLSSPGFIYLFAHLSTRTPPIVLGLLGIYLVLKKKPWWMISLTLALALVLHPETGLMFSFLALIADKNYLKNLRFVLLAVLLSGIFYVPYYLPYGIPQLNAIHEDYAARDYGMESLNLPIFSWETGKGSVTLLALALSFVGFYYTKNSFLREWFILAVALALISARFFLYIALPISFLAAAGLYAVMQRYKRYGRYILPGFVAYSLLIGAWFILDFGSSYPVKNQIDAFTWIRENTPENATVISDWAHGHWITGIAYHKSFVDGYAEYAPQADQRMEDLRLFFQNCTVPEGYGIQYAYLEDWYIKRENMTCIWNFPKVYDKDYSYVFKVSS